jgi:hypothetical protein
MVLPAAYIQINLTNVMQETQQLFKEQPCVRLLSCSSRLHIKVATCTSSYKINARQIWFPSCSMSWFLMHCQYLSWLCTCTWKLTNGLAGFRFWGHQGSELRKISGLVVPLGPILGSTESVKHLKIANWRTKIILKISWVPPQINEDTRKFVCACTDNDWTCNWWMFMPNEWWWHYLVRSLEKIHESDSMMNV